MWVVEWTAYMPDIDATNELNPICEIAVLTDTDGDGVMDERTVFLDGLKLPRSVAPTRDGALVILPPDLYFCRDTDGDGRAGSARAADGAGRAGAAALTGEPV